MITSQPRAALRVSLGAALVIPFVYSVRQRNPRCSTGAWRVPTVRTQVAPLRQINRVSYRFSPRGRGWIFSCLNLGKVASALSGSRAMPIPASTQPAWRDTTQVLRCARAPLPASCTTPPSACGAGTRSRKQECLAGNLPLRRSKDGRPRTGIRLAPLPTFTEKMLVTICSNAGIPGFQREDERMRIQEIPFCTVDWSAIEPTEHAGERGTAFWQTQHFGPRENSMRLPGYIPLP